MSRARRRTLDLLVFSVLATLAAAATTVTHSGSARQGSAGAPARRVWTGTISDRHIGVGLHDSAPIRRPVRYVHDIHVEFTYISESDPGNPGHMRWVSRKLRWTAAGSSASAITGTDCQGSGELDLGPSPGYDNLTDEQREALRIPCTSWDKAIHFTFIAQPPSWIPMPRIDITMANCETRRWNVFGADYTLSVAGEVQAVIDLDTVDGYRQFVPEPGRPQVFLARSLSGPAQFRFVLDPEHTSRLPGYATNGRIDDTFFDKYALTHVQRDAGYDDNGPDFLFDAAAFPRNEWSRVEPMVVETARPEETAGFVVTAMDYGAVGRLAGYVRSEACGAWQPISVRSGDTSRTSIDLPLDADGNLMADAVEEFRGLDPAADADAEPRGNGMGGDGLTAFEEYRGMVERGAGCSGEGTEAIYGELAPQNQGATTGWSDQHSRTRPDKKDLFIHTPDPELAIIAPMFGERTGLTVHMLCEPHYVDNNTRIVNFTLHRGGARRFRGRDIAHPEPQHGIFLEPIGGLTGLRGVAVPVEEPFYGPPRFTRAVQVRKPSPGASSNIVRNRLELDDLIHTTVHELGHAVGMPHHGDTVENWRLVLGKLNIVTYLSLQQHAGGPPDFSQPDSLPADPSNFFRPIDGRNYLTSLLVEPGEGCVEGAEDAVYYENGKFAGCTAQTIARRGQQNSGDFECPMRYSGAHYYEAPGSTAVYRFTRRVTYFMRAWKRYDHGYLVDAWGGKLLKYRNDLDRDGRGKFCERITGTGINALPGDENHSGDAGRPKSCSEFLVVNDLAARGAR